VVSSIESVEGATILLPPSPGSGERHQTITIVALDSRARLSTLTQKIEDAATFHRDEILPNVVTVITGKVKPSATPDAIMDALRSADLLEE
jgi:hypothetical protein